MKFKQLFKITDVITSTLTDFAYFQVSAYKKNEDGDYILLITDTRNNAITHTLEKEKAKELLNNLSNNTIKNFKSWMDRFSLIFKSTKEKYSSDLVVYGCGFIDNSDFCYYVIYQNTSVKIASLIELVYYVMLFTAMRANKENDIDIELDDSGILSVSVPKLNIKSFSDDSPNGLLSLTTFFVDALTNLKMDTSDEA